METTIAIEKNRNVELTLDEPGGLIILLVNHDGPVVFKQLIDGQYIDYFDSRIRLPNHKLKLEVTSPGTFVLKIDFVAAPDGNVTEATSHVTINVKSNTQKDQTATQAQTMSNRRPSLKDQLESIKRDSEAKRLQAIKARIDRMYHSIETQLKEAARSERRELESSLVCFLTDYNFEEAKATDDTPLSPQFALSEELKGLLERLTENGITAKAKRPISTMDESGNTYPTYDTFNLIVSF